MRYLFVILFSIVSLISTSNLFAAAGVASAHPLATQAGIEILKKGGNAFDAAVAITAAIAVVEPSGSGLGGGGFWLMHQSSNGESQMLDGRETAPAAAHRDMYLDSTGEIIPKLSIDGPLAAGIPGEPAALAWITENRGVLTLADNLAPAIRYAEEGFEIGEHYHRLMSFRYETILASSDAAAIFLDEGKIPEPGWVLRQPDLAIVLRAISEKGFDGFYRGPIARALVEGVQKAGGIWTLEDLANYRVILRQPIKANYNGMEITSASLPSSGGLVMAIALNQLAKMDLSSVDSLTQTHLLVETMRRAYRDRAAHMGDSDFVEVPIEDLLSDAHAESLKDTISQSKATPSSELEPIETDGEKGTDTTHFSVIDSDGNRVAATLSINYPFGSGFVAPGTGVLLNDEMDDFSSKPGTPNVYGLVGNEANSIAPGKRMLSSMSPTFLETKDRIAILGTPGGSRIISMVLQGALAFHSGASAKEVVSKGRIHHQYLPDRIQYEPDALALKEIVQLYAKGHMLAPRGRTWGNMQAVILDKTTGELDAASDPRGEGTAMITD